MDRTMMILILGVMLAAGAARATTWEVAKDGSGDFMVIQDAVDAASPGDVIWIRAGRYEELTEDFDVYGDGTVFADVHVAITKDDLTLRGDGMDATIIGPAVYPDSPDYNYIGITVYSSHATTLTVEDLAVENTNFGVFAGSQSCVVRRCRLEGNLVNGIRLRTSISAAIDDCEFIASDVAFRTWYPAANVSISNCTVELADYSSSRGFACVNTQNVAIDNCEFTGGGGAIDFQQGTTGIITNVTASGYHNYGAKVIDGASAEIYDADFEGGLWAIISNGNGVVCEDSSFRGQTYRTIYLNNWGSSSFTNCEILNGGGYSVYCDFNEIPDCHVDMTNCYWGTDSAEQIAEWIWDSNDDPERCCTVDFIPFNGSVATELHSWSAVKGLFDANGRE